MDIIFDIDGTLAQMNPERAAALDGPVKDYATFYDPDLVYRDTPIVPVIDALRGFRALGRENDMYNNTVGTIATTGSHRIILCTGRPKILQHITLAWIMEYVCLPLPPIYMRKDGDKRPDWQVKEELLMTMRFDGYRPVLAFDDRQQVVDMWRRHGLICAQVAEGNF